MAGGVMQLVAYGVQDVYLSGNPQITFFKALYKRHTNFAVEPIEQSFSGTADFGKTSVTATVARNGDLMSRVYLKARVSLARKDSSRVGKFAWCRRLGHAMIRECSVQIGGATVDRQTGEWMNVWHELARDPNLDSGYDAMIGDTPHMTELSEDEKTATLYIPLTFWFCRNNAGLALPLIALQYHEVNFKFNFASADRLVVKESGVEVEAHIQDASLLIDYVFLDSEERKRFAQSSHEYLIEQLQTPDEDTINEQNKKIRLSFNHPCKEVAWVCKMGKYNQPSSNTFIAYHPRDPDFVKRRVAETLYLMSLDVDSTEVDGTTTYSIRTVDNQYSTVSLGSPELDALVAELRQGVVVVTKKADETTVFDGVELPADFASDPFAYVEFMDNSWKRLPKSVVSSTVEQLGLDALDHPLYSMISKAFVTVNMPINYGVWFDGSDNPITEANIQLNGQDRFAKRDGTYFNQVQPWQHHSNTPCDGVNVYSFALKPEDHQPSGTCNFSRIDYAQLTVKLTNDAKNSLGTDSTITVFTTNYNVLRIMSGMGGLAYSN